MFGWHRDTISKFKCKKIDCQKIRSRLTHFIYLFELELGNGFTMLPKRCSFISLIFTCLRFTTTLLLWRHQLRDQDTTNRRERFIYVHKLKGRRENQEHGTFRNMLEHAGTFRNMKTETKIIFMKKKIIKINNRNRIIFVKINDNVK